MASLGKEVHLDLLTDRNQRLDVDLGFRDGYHVIIVGVQQKGWGGLVAHMVHQRIPPFFFISHCAVKEGFFEPFLIF